MQVRAAIIGGTGVGDRLRGLGGFPVHVPTPFGCLRSRVVEIEGASIAVVSRHAAGHRVPPHLVNYHAMAWGVRQLGARACFSSAAVGSLREDWRPGTLCCCADFIDMSGRNLTLYGREVVHTDFTRPFHAGARAAILEAARAKSVAIRDGGVYVNGNGPRYETPAEIEALRRLGGDLVGMTAGSEAIAMQEAGVPYACLAVVSNLASGMTASPLSHQEVVDVMAAAVDDVVGVLSEAAAKFELEK
jgi:5'-methylthioadenosine phosphorylase